MKPILLSFTFFILLSFSFCDSNSGNASTHLSKKEIADSLKMADSIEQQKLIVKAAEAFDFCKKKKMNTDFCLLLNYHKHSGLTRFYVWDFKLQKPIDSGMVSHGCGPNLWGHDDSKTNPVFSNVFESHCSSIGKYKIGVRGYSNWGIHVNYAMHGLDSTNSNSFGRQICMHSWEMVNDIESYPDGTPEGWGCAAVSNAFMTRLDALLKEQDVPVLLWGFF